MEKRPAPWVLETARLPIAFAQVREDALLDQWVVQHLQQGCKILMIASGGCTAAALAAMPQVARLHLVDANPAQLALSRLKLRLLTTTEAPERLSILGHTPMSADVRASRLASELKPLNLPVDALGPVELVARMGPDHAGRYEVLFAKLREALSEAEGELAALLQLRDPEEQSRRAAPDTQLGRVLDGAFDEVMSLPILVALFGEAATRNRREPFSRHFARRTRHVLGSLPAADNPYLWQMLQGRFPPEIVYPWLNASAPAKMPEVTWAVSTMTDALQQFSQEFDFIHLSNILDWLAPEEARATLDLTWKALRPGGWTFTRQLNSSLEIEALDKRFAWQDVKSLHERDRSFFYRGLHLGRKP
jgi:S-adenosylmethionine-diacylglycerol 3-amino-3-carboxypropyl transferase